MQINLDKISFISTVSNFKLYKKTSIFYNSNAKRYVIDGRNGMFGLNSFIFMMEKLKDEDVDWLIMIDEDGIIIDFNNILDLIYYMNENDFLISGMQDGGVIPLRNQSPFAINTYFSIINFKKLRKIWDIDQILKNQFITQNEFQLSSDYIKSEYNINSLFEDYYCFYFWILRNGYKILYLNADNPITNDTITNVLYNQNGQPIIYHTWYARLYGKSKFHTKRINKALRHRKKINAEKSRYINPIVYLDRSFKSNNKRVDFFRKIIRKIKGILSKPLVSYIK